MKSKARFVLDKKKLLEQYNIAKDLADEVSYSYKTNPFVGAILEKETKCMFSVHSKGLLKLIKDKSLPSTSLTFVSAVKQPKFP